MGFQLWSKLWSLWSQKRNNQINWNLLLQHPFLTCVLSISSIHFSFFCFSLFGQSDQKQKSAVLLIYFLLISVKTGFEERKKNKQTGQLISYFPSLWPNKEKWIDEINSDSKWNGQLLCFVILQSFLTIFCQVSRYLSQNLGADSHFEGLNVSKFPLIMT